MAGGSKSQIGEDHYVTLIEDNTSESLRDTTLGVTGSHDKLVIGSSYAYRDVSGLGGDDTLIITRHLTQDITISDTLGKNTVKFDQNVEITHVSQTIFGNENFVLIANITLTLLGTGASVNIPSPADGTYLFQLGDGEVFSYNDFVAEITKDGFVKDGGDNDTTELLMPIKIDIDRRKQIQTLLIRLILLIHHHRQPSPRFLPIIISAMWPAHQISVRGNIALLLGRMVWSILPMISARQMRSQI